MKIQITADSTCDLSQELYQKYDIKVIPFVVTLGDETYLDGSEIKPEDIFSYFDKNKELPKTGARSPEDLKKFFEPILKDGYEIIHFGIGSKLSSGYANCELVANQNDKIHLVNTKTLSSGSGLLAMYASELAQSGKYSASEIAEKCRKRADYHQSSFIVERLNYLYKGGRCSGLTNLVGKVFKIKPIIEVRNGKMSVGPKPRGKMINALNTLLEMIKKDLNNLELENVFVTHSLNYEDASYLETELKKFLPSEVKLYNTCAGCVISSHCGKGTIGILYVVK